MKKRISLLLVIGLILSFILTISTNAAGDDVVFSLEKKNAERGETITVSVDMDCTTSFVAGNFVLTYDANVLEYVPYRTQNNDIDYNQNCGEAILNNGVPIGTVLINNTAGTLKVGYMSTQSIAGKSGEFLKFQFKVKNNAAYGNSTISMSATTLRESNGNSLLNDITFNDGVVSILSGITMNNSSLNLDIGGHGQLTISSPNGTIFDEITWTSSDNNVVSVVPSADGKSATVTANSEGTATITATIGGKTATCTITVASPYSIVINDPSWTFLPPTQKRALTAYFNPADAGEGKTITWSSENTNIATVNSSTGEITAVANGNVFITATDGEKSAQYLLSVMNTLGDIDKDSNITSYDAYRALVLFGTQATGGQVNEDEVVILDVDRSGDMSSEDAYLILKYSVGLISNF